jgi:hypothetical protein
MGLGRTVGHAAGGDYRTGAHEKCRGLGKKGRPALSIIALFSGLCDTYFYFLT